MTETTDNHPGVPTKQVLAWLRGARATQHCLSQYEGADSTEMELFCLDPANEGKSFPGRWCDWKLWHTERAIGRYKQTLAGREHVPSKGERKRLRQAAAKKNRGQGKSRAR
jgi:hypothetical protein